MLLAHMGGAPSKSSDYHETDSPPQISSDRPPEPLLPVAISPLIGDLDDSAPESAPTKSNPLQELIESEKAYVDQLSGIIHKVAAAWSRKNMPPRELDAMFRSVEGVYKANRSLFSRLKGLGSGPVSPRELGDLLVRWIDDLEAPYAAYCDRYCAGFDAWALVARNPRQAAVLAAFSAASPPPASAVSPLEPGARPLWTLDALFLLPKGRLEYYKRLYGRLLRSTSPGRRDHALLAAAVDTFDRLLAAVEARGGIQVSAIARRSSWSSVEDTDDTPLSPFPETVAAAPPIEPAPPSMPAMDEEEAVTDGTARSLLAQHDKEFKPNARSAADLLSVEARISQFNAHIYQLNAQVSHFNACICRFNVEISPWIDPQQWHAGNVAHIQSIMGTTIHSPLIEEYLAPKSGMMMYPCHEKIKEDLQKLYFGHLSTPGLPPSLLNKAWSTPTIHTRDRFMELLTLDVIDLAAQLTIMLMDNTRYKTLVSCCGDSAQSLLNFLQARLDYPINDKFKPRHLKALVKLSEHSRRYPECLLLKGITLPLEPADGGSFGDVYKCRMEGNDIAVKVLKVYKKSVMNEILKGFAREAVIWRQLSHPNILPFYGIFRLGTEHERLCLVCPWMSNGNLSEYLSSIAPESYCVPLALDVAEGLAYLHSQSIVHADLKCANILVSHALRACLADFGLSLARDTVSVKFTASSMRDHGAVGTLNWTGPELLPDFHNPESIDYETRCPDQASDVYSFAMVCYEIFTGSIPFKGKRDHQIINAVIQGMRPGRPADLHAQQRGLTDSIWLMMVTCWDQLPTQRFSATQTVQLLRDTSGRPIDVRPPDDYNMKPLSRTMYPQTQHPFAMFDSPHRMGVYKDFGEI
ncbi:hypothetical protein HWV62_29725 [Athelia sp. TMB]|nr:hypothetical protein HWV62_29725 [Athelia sp. TMB]